MADPRFFENLGPFTLAQICEKAGIAVPADADAGLLLHDLADLAGAGPRHLTLFSGAATLRDAFAATRAAVCFVPDASSARAKRPEPPQGLILLEVPAIGPAFASVAAMFYPAHSQPRWDQAEAVSPDHKEAVLALVTGVGATVSMVLNPLWGAFSDRTVSRFGRRLP